MAAVPHLAEDRQVPKTTWQPLDTKPLGKADSAARSPSFYLTNPIARASTVMAELDANAKARETAKIAAE